METTLMEEKSSVAILKEAGAWQFLVLGYLPEVVELIFFAEITGRI